MLGNGDQNNELLTLTFNKAVAKAVSGHYHRWEGDPHWPGPKGLGLAGDVQVRNSFEND